MRELRVADVVSVQIGGGGVIKIILRMSHEATQEEAEEIQRAPLPQGATLAATIDVLQLLVSDDAKIEPTIAHLLSEDGPVRQAAARAQAKAQREEAIFARVAKVLAERR